MSSSTRLLIGHKLISKKCNEQNKKTKNKKHLCYILTLLWLLIGTILIYSFLKVNSLLLSTNSVPIFCKLLFFILAWSFWSDAWHSFPGYNLGFGFFVPYLLCLLRAMVLALLPSRSLCCPVALLWAGHKVSQWQFS